MEEFLLTYLQNLIKEIVLHLILQKNKNRTFNLTQGYKKANHQFINHFILQVNSL
jgi:hypothetical protein